MIIRYIVILKIVLVTFILFFASKGYGEVDPEWLRSWNEAVKMRPEKLNSTTKITPQEEPGIPLLIHGQVFKPDGKVVATDVLVLSYHRDHHGFDFGPNDNSVTSWRLQGWAKTDSEGKFKFHTIRPAPDHIGREGSHIHFTVVSKDYGRQWVRKIFFLDEAGFTDKEKKESAKAGLFGWLKEVKNIDGIQHINMSIKLKEKADF